MNLVPAPAGRRIGAYLIDFAIIWAVLIVLMLLFGNAMFRSTSLESAQGWGNTLIVLCGVLPVLYMAAKGTEGGSPGYRATGLRLVVEDSGEVVGAPKAAGRWVLLCILPFAVFSPLFDGERMRGWHDKAVKTLVIDARASVLPGAKGARAESVAPAELDGPTSGGALTEAPEEQQTSAAAEPAALASAPASDVLAPPAKRQASETSSEAPAPVEAPSTVAAPAQPAPPAPAAPAAAPAVISAVPGFDRPAAPPAAAPQPPATPAQVIAPPVAAAASAVVGDDEQDDLDATRLAPRATGALVLRWDDGTTTQVTPAMRIGRDPAAGDGEAIAISDATRSLSKTHLEASPAEGGILVTDLHSTNGTGVQRAGGSVQTLVPGTATMVSVGDSLVIGERTCVVGRG